MITQNDQSMFNFVDDFHAATTSQLRRLFFKKSSYQYTCKRIKYLADNGYIKQTKSTLDNGYAYYNGTKPVQLHHDLIRAELFVSLKDKYKVLAWNNEEKVKNIRPDATAYVNNSAFTYIDDHGIVFPVFIEIHLNNHFNFDKYKELIRTTNLKELYGIMPRVIICTDRQVTVPNIGIKFKVIGLDMSGLDTLFK
jgi:hypothetical protein